MTREVKGSGSDVFADGGEDDYDAPNTTERSTPSADSYSNPAVHLDGQHNHTRSPPQDPVAASIYAPDLKDGHVARHTHRQEATRDVPVESPKHL